MLSLHCDMTRDESPWSQSPEPERLRSRLTGLQRMQIAVPTHANLLFLVFLQPGVAYAAAGYLKRCRNGVIPAHHYTDGRTREV